MLIKLAAIFFSMILVNNYVLVKFYGICPFLGVSKKFDSAVGMSGAVIFVMFMATAVTFPLQIFVLNPAGLSYLQTIVFILVIAVLVQFIEIFLKKYVVALYNSLGVYLPLITTNCCVLAVTILVVDDYGADVEALGFGAAYIEALVCAIGAGVGFMLAPLENMKVYSDGFQPDGDGATIVAIGSKAKNKARLERYDQMEQEARNNKKLDFSEIQIPAGPRLGSTVLEAEHIHKAFGDRVLIDDLSFTLPRNGIVGVIGPNGVGKSTLFKTIVGLEPLTSGSLKIGDTVKISYVDQNRAGLDPNKNLWEAVSDGLDFIEVAGVEVPTRAYVASFGFKGSDQQKRAGVLSGGERNRLNLALTLKQGGNLLLLDEPTNDLDVETLESLENALLAFPGCAVVISHDRWFLDRVATHILAWEGTDENPANWYWFEGNFQAYQENRIARLGEDAARPHRLHRKLTR